MKGFSTEKLNSSRSFLSLIVVLLVAVFSVNLALADDAMLFAVFYIVTAAASAYLVKGKSHILALTASFLGWAAALMLTKSAMYALISVSYLPFSLTIPHVGKNKLTRSGAIGIGAACVTGGTVAVLLYVTYLRIETISLSAIRVAFPLFFKQISEILYDSFYVSVAGTEVSLIAESNVVGYLNVIICLIPAAISALMTLVGYIIAWLYKKLVEITATADIDESSWALVPSPITAIVFIIAIVTLMIFEKVDLISLTALNMFVILLPVILLTGLLTSLTPKVTNGIPRPRLLRPLTLIISVCNGVVPFASLCIFYGLFDSFRASLSKRKPKNQE